MGKIRNGNLGVEKFKYRKLIMKKLGMVLIEN